MNYRIPDNIGGQHEILKCIILKIEKKKRKEDVCSSTKSISDKERRNFLSLMPNKQMLSLF